MRYLGACFGFKSILHITFRFFFSFLLLRQLLQFPKFSSKMCWQWFQSVQRLCCVRSYWNVVRVLRFASFLHWSNVFPHAVRNSSDWLAHVSPTAVYIQQKWYSFWHHLFVLPVSALKIIIYNFIFLTPNLTVCFSIFFFFN